MITRAVYEDRTQLIKLWKICFDDDDELIDEFLSACDYKNILVYREEKNVVSVLYMVPMNHGETVYFYALGTLPEFRNKGIMGILIRKALDICRNNGAKFAFLIPAEESLEKYYEKFGFFGRILLADDKCDFFLRPDSYGITEFVKKEESHEKAGTKHELYGAYNALAYVFEGALPEKIAGYIPF